MVNVFVKFFSVWLYASDNIQYHSYQGGLAYTPENSINELII